MTRRVLLMAALAIVLGLSAWLALRPGDPAQSVVAVVQPVDIRRSAAPASMPPQASSPQPRPASAWGTPPAAALAAWSAPRAAPAATVASAPESAPPPRFPYTWIGRFDDGATVQALLNGPQRSFGVRAGEVLDGRWRVEAIAATRLQLTWLPTGESVNVDTR